MFWVSRHPFSVILSRQFLSNTMPAMLNPDFPESAPCAPPVYSRTYARRLPMGGRETWEQTNQRTIEGLTQVGNLTDDEIQLLDFYQRNLITLTSGRWLWVGGTEWVRKPENFFGAYNCTSAPMSDLKFFGLLMDLAMMGCGTGAVLEPKFIQKLPSVTTEVHLTVLNNIGHLPPKDRSEQTHKALAGKKLTIWTGDSRQGWVESYMALLNLATSGMEGPVYVVMDLSNVRPPGEKIKGFGGVANPEKLAQMYQGVVRILNGAVGRQLNSLECCLLIDEAAVTIVAGNVRRCLPEDALVHTDRGLVPIRDVQVGDRVQTPIGFRRVTNKFDQGIQDVYEVEANSIFPRATLSHRMAVLSDAKGGVTWKRLEEMEAGDRLCHNIQTLPGSVTSLPPDTTAQRPDKSRTAKSITIPDLTADVAWLIGFTHGNGYVALGRNKHGKSYGNVGWSMNASQPELTQEIQEKIDRALALFGLTSTRSTLKNENTAKSICSSIRLAEYFYQHIKQPKQPLTVPTFILQGPIEVRAAYLAGLMDSDGSVKNRPPYLVTTVYPHFARQVGAVLSSLGIAGRMAIVRPQVDHWQVKYNISIPALKGLYNAIIAPHSLKGSLREGLKMYGFTLPGEMMRAQYTYSEMQAMGFQGSRRVDSNYERYRAESEVEIDIPVTVKGLGSYDSVQTYDIEVEEAHCFYCDGYLTHNSAGIRQFAENDTLGRSAKKDLWQQDENGNWRIDPMRDALRMANHTLVYHRKPSLEELIDTVRQQYYSGEGAIQYAPEAIARANVDIVNTDEKRSSFFESYLAGDGESSLRHLYLEEYGSECPPDELEHRLTRYGLNPCAEIVGGIFGCNLSEIHLNQIDPLDFYTQESAFRAGGLSVAVLLHHTFAQEDYRKSREMDPIVGVSFTGLFDFFVNAFGVDWLRWWQAGRPDTWGGTVPYVPLGEGVSPGSEEYLNLAEFYKVREAEYLDRWRKVAEKSVQNYCFRNNLKTPNRCTTVQPAGCGSRELLRIFDQGLIYADEVMEDGEGEVKDIGLTVRGGIPAATGIANQPLHLMKVTLANKRVLRLTPNHRLSVEGKWVRADELLPGVSIDHQFGEYRSNTEALLLPIDLTAHTKYNPSLPFGEFRKGYVVNIRLPDQTSPELGYLIGAIFGNGSCSQGRNRHRIRITHQRLSVIEKLQGISQELFRLPGKISHPTPQVHEICFDSSLLHGWMTLNKISKTSSSKKLNRIPLAIRMGSRETILGFFAGLLDTDGCVREGGRTSIESASEEFVRNLQQIGEAVGLCFSISHNTKGSNFQGEKNIWSLSLIRRHSQSEAIDWLNANSLKLKDRPIPPCAPSQSASKTSPYTVVSVEPESDPDYSFDFAIDGVDDDDSWYWQGALKSHNTKSLLSGASPGWHPPKAARFIRRITFRRDDPVALACLDYGYPIVPAQSCKDENGNLLAKDQYLDPRATEWLVEIPTAATWADLPGVDEIDISQFSATAQFDFFMQVQKHYTRHNCFSRDTRFMTDKGIRSFDDFVEGQEVIVLNLHCDWVPATIVKTGDIRPMLQITLKEEKSGRTKKIVSTHCHRFVAYDVRRPRPEQEVVVAKDLAVWHRLAYNTTFLVTATDKQKYDDSYLSWQVIDVRESEPEEGWCVMEPLTNHFTLEDNILVMNTSATIELREPEIEPLAQAIHEAIQNDEGYISAALLARFDDLETFPRLPFEPIDKATYDLLVAEVKARRKTDDFHEALARYDAQAEESFEAGPTACDSETCQLPR